MLEERKSNNVYLILLAAIVCGMGLVGAVIYFGHPLAEAPPPAIVPPVPAVETLPATPQTPEEMRAENDSAVKLIGDGKIDDAIEILEPLLRRHPRYVTARENLCVAYNNKAVSKTNSNKVCLDLLRRAVSLDSENSDAQSNLSALIKSTGRDPLKFEDRVFMGNEEARAGCLYGAYVEYTAALSIHNDASVTKKRDDIVEKMAASSNDDKNGAFYIRMAKRDEAYEKKVGDNSVDFAAYMMSFKNAVKDKWVPPNSESSEKVEVSVTISPDGTLGNISVTTSSGDKHADAAAVEAVKALGKAEPLPLRASVPIDATLSFVHGVSDNGTAWRSVR
ncbi:MAG: TonB family protein [Cyanobacteria bacterium REEB67]|nr:TonB family protein [Cyanobacteria bacterium REEB67]